MARVRLLPLLLLVLAPSCAGAETLYVVPDLYNRRWVTTKPHDEEAAPRSKAEAVEAAERGDLSDALRLASHALWANPGDAELRRAFGYELVDHSYLTGYQAKQAKRGLRWNSRFGWVKPDDLPRWEAGERLDGKRWISEEIDTQRHAAIDDGWQVRTDHFVITTNHSRESGARLAVELENLYQVWRQLFAAFWLDERDVRLALAGERSLPQPRRPFRVFYHRDKAGYIEHLRRRQPQIAQTLGIYFDTAREAHFYHSDDPTEAARLRPTLYHEAAHQLFQESATKARSPGENANFWVIEGVACWFETLRPAGDSAYTIGRGGRLRSAARRADPIPIAELVALGQADLQRQPDLAAIYAQSTALVAMLMEEHPQQFTAYLRSVYNRRPDADELSRRLDLKYSELDAAYRRFAVGRLAELAEPAPGH